MKQDKATTSIPVQKIKSAVYKAYCNKGMSSACDVANKHGIDYEYCKACECETPAIDHECLICGQETKDATPSPSIPVKIKVGDKMKFNKDSDTVTCIEVSKDGRSVKSSGGQWYDMDGTILVSSIPVNDEIYAADIEDGINKDFSLCKKIAESYNYTYGKGYDPTAMEELYKALDKAVGYLADLNGSNWITGEDAGSLDMKQRAKGLQSILYTALHNAKTK